ncbi:unnamed protein product [Gadus morhua 'NCC']
MNRQTHDEEEDDEDNTSGFKKDNLRRNSRFYRSMRKKRLPSSESSQTSGSIKAVYEPDAVSRVKSLNVQPRKPQAPITRRNPVQGDGGGGGGGPQRDVAYASNVYKKPMGTLKDFCNLALRQQREMALIPGMVINERSPQAKVESGHSLNIVKNIAFLYQEYGTHPSSRKLTCADNADGLTVKAEASGGLS